MAINIDVFKKGLDTFLEDKVLNSYMVPQESEQHASKYQLLRNNSKPPVGLLLGAWLATMGHRMLDYKDLWPDSAGLNPTQLAMLVWQGVRGTAIIGRLSETQHSLTQ